MIDPKNYYDHHDGPTEPRKKTMWNHIEREITPGRSPMLIIADRRSFYFGIAAAVILYCAGIGVFHVVSNAFQQSRPDVMKVDRAVQTAITALEQAMPAVLTTVREEPVRERLNSRFAQLKMIDAAIVEAQQESNSADLSPMSRSTLRELYSLKLKILQQMIEQGEIGL